MSLSLVKAQFRREWKGSLTSLLSQPINRSSHHHLFPVIVKTCPAVSLILSLPRSKILKPLHRLNPNLPPMSSMCIWSAVSLPRRRALFPSYLSLPHLTFFQTIPYSLEDTCTISLLKGLPQLTSALSAWLVNGPKAEFLANLKTWHIQHELIR